PGSSREPARLPVPVLSNRQRWPHRRLVTVAASLALFAIAAWPITRAFQKIRTPVGPPRQSEAETQAGSSTAFSDAGPEHSSDWPTTIVPPNPGEGPVRGVPATLFDAGHTVGLDRKGSLVGFDYLSPDLREALTKALRRSNLELPRFEQFEEAPGVLMGPGPYTASFSVRSPIAGMIEESRPLLAWVPAAEDATYYVTIREVRSGHRIHSPPLQETQWKPAASLVRGGDYCWEVKAVFSDGRWTLAPAPPQPAARFRIVAKSDEMHLKQARALYPKSHLLLGVLYAKAGLIAPAKKELESLALTNPKSLVAKKLLRQVNEAALQPRASHN